MAGIFEIVRAASPDQWADIRALASELVAWDMAEAQRAGLDPDRLRQFYYTSGRIDVPGDFLPPAGELLLACCDGAAAASGAFHPLAGECCEIKLMYARPAFLGNGLGLRILEELLARARKAGYRLARLETATFMRAAIRTYERAGFRRCAPYYEIPAEFAPLTVFMERALA